VKGPAYVKVCRPVGDARGMESGDNLRGPIIRDLISHTKELGLYFKIKEELWKGFKGERKAGR
jgi:hypothetical protein